MARDPQDVGARVAWNRAIGMPLSTVVVLLVAVPLLFFGDNPNPYVAGGIALGVAGTYYALFIGAQAVATYLPPHDMPGVDLMCWAPATLFLTVGCWLNARIPS
jgi:lipopolysaccharide export LptBFGC system permease protein LptF